MHGRWQLFLLCLLIAAPFSASADTALVTANSLSLRERASRSSRRIETLRTYEPLFVKSRRGEWAEVVSTAGKTGWVLAKYLSERAFVSVDVSRISADKLNVRRGPGTSYKVVFRIAQSYPLRVLDRVAADGSNWLMVLDYEGDRGWISGKLVTRSSQVITRLEKCNVRTGPGTENPIAFTTERGVLLKVISERSGWLKVRHADGDEGWISAKIVFGWLEVSAPSG